MVSVRSTREEGLSSLDLEKVMLELSIHNRELESLPLSGRSLHDLGLDPPRGVRAR